MIPVVGEVFDLADAGISYARGDYLGASLSMAAAIPGIGNVAGLAKLAHKASKVFGKGRSQIFERVVSNAELKATQRTGLLRGGREGENFFTNSASLDAKRAQQRLGLSGPLRDARIRFKIKNNVEITGPRPAAPGQTGTAGGGMEFSTNARTKIKILRVDPLRK